MGALARLARPAPTIQIAKSCVVLTHHRGMSASPGRENDCSPNVRRLPSSRAASGGSDEAALCDASTSGPVVDANLLNDAHRQHAFVNTNRGHSPEGFIPSGQKPSDGESLDDGLFHS